nr:hypothetical protein [Tanacetum cinerariifolium]
STIPPADQVETLTVESPIPTASSPVPTACFTDCQEPSSKTRLISKRVTNHEETPSLDNILTLTNRFEDILEVTTNSEESNGVEDDVSNMETTITASPTPTLRIHRDHPKSQIIGPVDTPIQTRNKFKKVGEHEPKKIYDTLQDPSWVEAMQEELLQFKIQKVWTLVDCPKGIRPIRTKWVLKNKKDERGIVIRNEARLVAQRHTQEEGIDYDEGFVPVAKIEAIRLFLAYASFMGFTVYQIDVKSAFLYGTINQEVYVMQPPRFQDPKYPARVYKVEKAMYGLHKAPRAWHQVTPKECQLHAVKRIFRYLKGHPKLGLWYPKDSPFDLVAYSDSDYSGATRDHKSTTGGPNTSSSLIFHPNNPVIMVRLAFCDYHNMVAILEKYEQNTDFHQIVDFVGASHIRYALTFNPTIYVSHIRQFWSTARIETTDEGTKILATVDGILRTVTKSSIRRNLKLNDEEGLSSLPDMELFENLTLMRYNISPNQKLTFQKGQFFHQWKFLIYTIMQCLSPKSTRFNEFSSNIATALICLATNKTYNFSKMIFDGLVKNVNNKVLKFLMYPRTVPLFDTMRIQQGEGSGTPTEPHHTHSLEAQPSSHTLISSPTLPTVTTIPTITPSEITPLRQYTQSARIAQSSALPPVADEPASPMRDVSQGEACLTDSGFIADQDRVNIAKTSTLPYESTSRVTSLAADEGSLQLRFQELTDFCTILQRKQSELVSKFASQALEIKELKARVKFLEDRQGDGINLSRDDAPIKGRRLDEEEVATERVSSDTEEIRLVEGEVAAERVSDDTEEMATVLITMDAASVLSIPTASTTISTATPIFATATTITPYTRRKEKEKMVETHTSKKKKRLQEQIDIQFARELEEELEREAQRMNAQITRDEEIAKIHAEEELQQMIKDHHSKILQYQAQQRKTRTKKQKRDFYMAVIRNNLGWKVKDFKGTSFEEVEAKFKTVWEQIEGGISKISEGEAAWLKRKGMRSEQESAKK